MRAVMAIAPPPVDNRNRLPVVERCGGCEAAQALRLANGGVFAQSAAALAEGKRTTQITRNPTPPARPSSVVPQKIPFALQQYVRNRATGKPYQLAKALFQGASAHARRADRLPMIIKDAKIRHEDAAFTRTSRDPKRPSSQAKIYAFPQTSLWKNGPCGAVPRRQGVVTGQHSNDRQLYCRASPLSA